jgi:hypothetical protein
MELASMLSLILLGVTCFLIMLRGKPLFITMPLMNSVKGLKPS